MEIVQETWSASMVDDRRHLIDPQPAYQRGPVWTLLQKQRLIDSMLRRYDIPKFYLTRVDDPDSKFEHEVTDGQQRLRAIWDFLDNDFPLGDESVDIPDFGDLAGAKFSDLVSRAKDRVKLFKISVAEIRDASPNEVRELFLRLQEGTSLNPAEKRNAMIGEMRDFVAGLGANHTAFSLTHISDSRFGWHDLAAHVVKLELSEGSADVKAVDLREMYLEEQGFDVSGAAAERVLRTLDYLSRVLHSRPAEMRIKWGFVDLYLAVSELLHRRGIDMEGREEDVLLMFQGFERDRRAVEDPAELLADGDAVRPENIDLYRYIEAFAREGATRSNVGIRHDVYLKRLALQMPDLADPMRSA